jgi:hypothetical protein
MLPNAIKELLAAGVLIYTEISKGVIPGWWAWTEAPGYTLML